MKHFIIICISISLLVSELSATQDPILVFDSAYDTDDTPLLVKSADFDLDGYMDLVVASYGADNIRFYFNKADGTFLVTRSYLCGETPIGLDVGDIDGDGFDDVAVATGTEGGLVVFKNNGNRTFRGAAELFAYGAVGVAVGQLDDLYGEEIVFTRNDNRVYVFWNWDNFDYFSTFHGGRSFPISFAIEDLDNDGLIDIGISNLDESQYFYTILWNQSQYAFTVHPEPLDVGGGGTIPILASDVNSDGLIDLAVARSEPYAAFEGISILINKGGRVFENPENYFFEGGITDATLGDFDGVNGIDIAAANWGFEPYVSLLLNEGNGTFGNRIDIPIGNPGYGLTAADFDCDKDLDVAVVWPFDSLLAIFVNNTTAETPSILPAVIQAAMAHPVNPTPGFLILENFTNGHRAADVDTLTLRINETIELSSFLVLYPDYGPCDKFIRAEFDLQEFVSGYGILWDTAIQTYTVTGEYSDGTEFSVEGQVTMLGHRSGDFNRDGSVTISDLSVLANFVFRGGPSPLPIGAGDIDGHCGNANISDLNYFVNFLFRNGPAPTHICAN